ncbi:hypothetical protein OR1_01088 [Geobacter sp. OR-1]|uniref:putative polyvalent protein kinase domain-containing protein n=1 Tax=Geobacter sp. OR-1 TaxID=1266765 RepID=UPI0005427908|nr:hypothetical protein [Geobacter sp. OR-1]GAM08814.1 hypothetical protein OR1_01088 [Geobacter sp. OR-1]
MEGENHELYQTGNKCGLQTGSIEAIRQSIQDLQDYLEAGDRPDKVYSGEFRKQQDRKALEWATQNDKQVIPETDFLALWRHSGKIRGGENLVYFMQDADGLTWAIKMNELTYHHGDMAALAERLIKSSEYFPDTTLEIIGMVATPRGVKPLLRQEFVVTNPRQSP